jgi:hypothetical protein
MLKTNFEFKNYLNYKSNVIHIWQGERNDGALQFMYKPVILSCVKYLEYSNNDIIIDYKINYYNFNEIKANEILIWIGCENIPNFDILKKEEYIAYIIILNQILINLILMKYGLILNIYLIVIINMKTHKL